MLLLCQTLLMATSHSCNLLVYCMSNPAFRRKLYIRILRKQGSISSISNTPTVALHNLSQRRIGSRGPMSKDDSSTISLKSQPKLRHSLSTRVRTTNEKRQFCSNTLQESDRPLHLNVEYKASRAASITTREAMLHPEMPMLRRYNSF